MTLRKHQIAGNFSMAGLHRELQLEGSAERGGDSLSLQFQIHSVGDRLSPPPLSFWLAGLVADERGANQFVRDDAHGRARILSSVAWLAARSAAE